VIGAASTSGWTLWRAERRRIESAARHSSRSGDELLLPQSGARRRYSYDELIQESSGSPERITGHTIPAAQAAASAVKVVILYDPAPKTGTAETSRA